MENAVEEEDQAERTGEADVWRFPEREFWPEVVAGLEEKAIGAMEL